MHQRFKNDKEKFQKNELWHSSVTSEFEKEVPGTTLQITAQISDAENIQDIRKFSIFHLLKLRIRVEGDECRKRYR